MAEKMTAAQVSIARTFKRWCGAKRRSRGDARCSNTANSNQRFLTEEAASAGGFAVLGFMNEPSAAAIEYAYRNNAERKHRAGGSLLVYDLGGF